MLRRRSLDSVDPDSQTGWSALVQETAAIASDAETMQLNGLAAAPWVAGEQRWVVIHALEVSGRELGLGSR